MPLLGTWLPKKNGSCKMEQSTDIMLTELANGVSVGVLASAGASVSKIRGVHGGALKVAVRAAPENGKANAEIEALLAVFFGAAKKACGLPVARRRATNALKFWALAWKRLARKSTR